MQRGITNMVHHKRGQWFIRMLLTEEHPQHIKAGLRVRRPSRHRPLKERGLRARRPSKDMFPVPMRDKPCRNSLRRKGGHNKGHHQGHHQGRAGMAALSRAE